MGRRCCFPAVYLSDPPVLPEQLQASRQQYVHAPGNGIYYPDKTESRPGDASVCDRCGGSSRDMDHPVHHRPGVAAWSRFRGSTGSGACASRRGVRDRKYFLRSPALPDVRGIYGAAIRVCKTALYSLWLPCSTSRQTGHDH